MSEKSSDNTVKILLGVVAALGAGGVGVAVMRSKDSAKAEVDAANAKAAAAEKEAAAKIEAAARDAEYRAQLAAMQAAAAAGQKSTTAQQYTPPAQQYTPPAYNPTQYASTQGGRGGLANDILDWLAVGQAAAGLGQQFGIIPK
ncbi:hypothetical protein [Corallococcus sp. EGB]|uniref:hypothetical protein n=1 Tax=Corallococcus sp. EGB TaxID=1521117 RepID=UPI001CC16600|nr:hypothetical protein [Corallococcus sp. EGB]